jgi:hypothetical protein
MRLKIKKEEVPEHQVPIAPFSQIYNKKISNYED